MVIFYQNIELLTSKINEIRSDYQIALDLQQNEKITCYNYSHDKEKFIICTNTSRCHYFNMDQNLQLVLYKIIDLNDNNRNTQEMVFQQRKSTQTKNIFSKNYQLQNLNSSNHQDLDQYLQPEVGIIYPTISCYCTDSKGYILTKDQLYIVNLKSQKINKKLHLKQMLKFAVFVQQLNEIRKDNDRIGESQNIKILLKDIKVSKEDDIIAIAAMINYVGQDIFAPSIILLNKQNKINIICLEEIDSKVKRQNKIQDNNLSYIKKQSNVFKENQRFTSEEAIQSRFNLIFTLGKTIDIQLNNNVYQVQLSHQNLIPEESQLFGKKLSELNEELLKQNQNDNQSQIKELPLFIRNYIINSSDINDKLYKQFYDDMQRQNKTLFQRLTHMYPCISISSTNLLQIKFKKEKQQQQMNKSLRQSMRQSMLLSSAGVQKSNIIYDLDSIVQSQIQMNRKFNKNTLFIIIKQEQKIIQAFINQIGQKHIIEYATGSSAKTLIENFTYYMRNEQLHKFQESEKYVLKEQAKKLIEQIEQRCLINPVHDNNWLQVNQVEEEKVIEDMQQANDQKINELIYCIQYLKELQQYDDDLSKQCIQVFQILKFIQQLLRNLEYNQQLSNLLVNIYNTDNNKEYQQKYQLLPIESVLGDCQQFIDRKIDQLLIQSLNNQEIQHIIIDCLNYVVQEEILNINTLLCDQNQENKQEEQYYQEEQNEQEQQKNEKQCSFVSVENILDEINIYNLSIEELIQLSNFYIYYLQDHPQITGYLQQLIQIFSDKEYNQNFAQLLIRYDFWKEFQDYAENKLDIQNYQVENYCDTVYYSRELQKQENNILFKLALYYEEIMDEEIDNVSMLDIENRKLIYLRENKLKPKFLLPEEFLITIRNYCIEFIDSGKIPSEIDNKAIDIIYQMASSKIPNYE